MSQEKVDKYKKEKKNRKKTIKRNRIIKALCVFVAALGVGALVGIPLGKYIYKVQKEEEVKNRTIVSSDYETWFNDYINNSYSQVFGGSSATDDASSTDATEENVVDDTIDESTDETAE